MVTAHATAAAYAAPAVADALLLQLEVPLDATGATWADLTLDAAVRDHLRAALALLDS